ncbi:hypothetical protein ES703_25046 [subsurface metagenome]|nr:heparinase [Dehalococcoidia bacterium]
MNFYRFFHTVRYLKPIQIYGRLLFHLRRPKPDFRPAPTVRPCPGLWLTPAAKPPSMLSPSRFRFLNEEHQIADVSAWNNSAWGKLWLYNLHYFDDLNAHEARARHKWHVTLLDRWIKENTPTVGNGWEPYPLSLRIVNWIKWILAGNELAEGMVHSLAVQARFLRKRLEVHLLGNHLWANAKALVFAGLFFDGPEAEAWLKKGLKLLTREVPEQILPDGGHFERSPMYHSIVLEDLLDLLNLSRTYWEAALPSVYRSLLGSLQEAIQRMRFWLKVMCHPDGEIALFNDAAFGIAPDPAQIEAYAARLCLGEVADLQKGITHLPASGYVRLSRGDAVVFLDIGEIGPDYLTGHAHADNLTFELSLFGQRAIINSGTSCYKAGPARMHQRSTAAHNTVEVNGQDSSELWGSFRVARRARPFDLTMTDEGDKGLMVSCAHNGYRRLPGRVIHRRSWRLTHNRLDITDELEGTYQHAVTRFHWHPDVALQDGLEKNIQSASFSLDNRQVIWASSGKTGRLERGTYHPEFGLHVPNIIHAIDFHSDPVLTSISWP